MYYWVKTILKKQYVWPSYYLNMEIHYKEIILAYELVVTAKNNKKDMQRLALAAETPNFR